MSEYPDPFETLYNCGGRGYKWPLGVWMRRKFSNDPRDEAWGIKLSPWLRIDILIFPNRVSNPSELVAVISANGAKGVRIEGIEGVWEAKRRALQLASEASLYAIDFAAKLDDDLLKERKSHPIRRLRKVLANARETHRDAAHKEMP